MPEPSADETTLAELLDACALEPIHVPEAVQNFGALLAVDREGIVRVRSDDPLGLLAGDAELGTPLEAALGADTAARIRAGAAPFTLAAQDGRTLDVEVHAVGDLTVVDLVSVAEPVLASDELIARQRPLWRARTLQELLEATVGEVRALTGFDRVMAYRFDAEWNGEVVAEARADALEPYLGLRYPASDIPAQARELYRRNPARLIPDVDGAPSPLRHHDPSATAPLDLSESVLRSVSPIHLQYLRNMGVRASMSLALLVDGQLWGLVACHHVSSPRCPDPARRRAATAVAELASALLVAASEAEALSERLVAADRMGSLRRSSEDHDDVLAGLTDDGSLPDVVEAVGAVVSIDGRTVALGETPELERVRTDVDQLLAGGLDLGATDALDAPGTDLVGVLAASLGDPRSWIAWYRPELVREVHWAGDPKGDEITTGPTGRLQLGPRRSFATFVEQVRGHSRAWSAGDRWAARELAESVRAVIARRTHQSLVAATVVQRVLLLDDAAVETSGFDAAVRYRPAHGDPVGGDWHDVFHLPDGSVAFVVGDTVGHGVEVAGIMAQLRHALRAYLVAQPSPAHALDRVSELVEQLLPGELATGVVCVVHPGSGRVEVATAGHLPPVRIGGGGAEVLAVPNGPALGLRRQRASSSFVGTLAEGEGLVLFSDGLVERRGVNLADSLQGLRAHLAGVVPAPATVVCDAALAAVPGPTDDDLTVLAFLRPSAGRV